MTELMSVSRKLYQTPSDAVLQNRRTFYSKQKLKDEPMTQWLWRIRDCIVGCEFDALSEFLLIDKFICELVDTDEIHRFKNIESLSLKQLFSEMEGEAIEKQTISMRNNESYGQSERSSTVDGVQEIENDNKCRIRSFKEI